MPVFFQNIYIKKGLHCKFLGLRSTQHLENMGFTIYRLSQFVQTGILAKLLSYKRHPPYSRMQLDNKINFKHSSKLSFHGAIKMSINTQMTEI